MRMTVLPPARRPAWICGCMIANASSASASNCNSNSRLRRSRWNGAFARRSSTDRFHSSVHAIGCARRRSFRKYKSMSGGITAAARISPAGIEIQFTVAALPC